VSASPFAALPLFEFELTIGERLVCRPAHLGDVSAGSNVVSTMRRNQSYRFPTCRGLKPRFIIAVPEAGRATSLTTFRRSAMLHQAAQSPASNVH